MGKPERPCSKCGQTIPANDDFCSICTAGAEDYAKPLRPKTAEELRSVALGEAWVHIFIGMMGAVSIPCAVYYSLPILGEIRQKAGQTVFIFITLIVSPACLTFWVVSLLAFCEGILTLRAGGRPPPSE